MQDISKINELLTINSSIIKKRKNYLFSALLIIAGIFIIIYTINNKSLSIPDPLKTVIFLFGLIVSSTGIMIIALPSKKLIYKTTGEKIKKQVLYFDEQKENSVMEKLLEGNYSILKEIATEYNDGPLRAEIYSTESGNFSVAQLQKYVPFDYEPIMEPNVLKK